MSVVDLNADLGEGDPHDAELLTIVSSCNIACGGHAGDETSMRTTIANAITNNVAVGAHPSYPDREGFGRRSGYMVGEALADTLRAQIKTLFSIAAEFSIELSHVKPHGALYNDAVTDLKLATIVANAIREAAPKAAMVGLPGSELQTAANAGQLRFIGEGFIDRAYQENGQLVPRSEPGAVYDSLNLVLPQAIALADTVDTLCIHGDTPGAADTARVVRDELLQQGVTIRAFSGR